MCAFNTNFETITATIKREVTRASIITTVDPWKRRERQISSSHLLRRGSKIDVAVQTSRETAESSWRVSQFVTERKQLIRNACARARAALRAAAGSLAETTQINFKSQHILRFDVFSSDVQSVPPYPRNPRARVHIDRGRSRPFPRPLAGRNSPTPPIPFLLLFSYNAPPYGSLILD